MGLCKTCCIIALALHRDLRMFPFPIRSIFVSIIVSFLCRSAPFLSLPFCLRTLPSYTLMICENNITTVKERHSSSNTLPNQGAAAYYQLFSFTEIPFSIYTRI